jgi:hypothetical protein
METSNSNPKKMQTEEKEKDQLMELLEAALASNVDGVEQIISEDPKEPRFNPIDLDIVQFHEGYLKIFYDEVDDFYIFLTKMSADNLIGFKYVINAMNANLKFQIEKCERLTSEPSIYRYEIEVKGDKKAAVIITEVPPVIHLLIQDYVQGNINVCFKASYLFG